MKGLGRRTFLAGALAGPAWLATAFAAEPSARQVGLFSTWHRARRAGQPVLAVVIPDGGEDHRGRVVGAALVEADDALLAALSPYAPVCATRDDLHLLGAAVSADAWFVAIATSAVPASVREIAGPHALGDIDGTKRVLLAALGAPAVDRDALVAARDTWVTGRLPGSHWATATGCGLHVEYDQDEEQDGLIYMCGMGSVPARAARFLLFS